MRTSGVKPASRMARSAWPCFSPRTWGFLGAVGEHDRDRRALLDRRAGGRVGAEDLEARLVGVLLLEAHLEVLGEHRGPRLLAQRADDEGDLDLGLAQGEHESTELPGSAKTSRLGSCSMTVSGATVSEVSRVIRPTWKPASAIWRRASSSVRPTTLGTGERSGASSKSMPLSTYAPPASRATTRSRRGPTTRRGCATARRAGAAARRPWSRWRRPAGQGGRTASPPRQDGGRLDRVAGEVALDVGLHRGRALVAVLDALGQRLHHDRVDLGVELSSRSDGGAACSRTRW